MTRLGGNSGILEVARGTRRRRKVLKKEARGRHLWPEAPEAGEKEKKEEIQETMGREGIKTTKRTRLPGGCQEPSYQRVERLG